MNKESVIMTCNSLLRRNTPLDFDCGKLCDGRCCKGDSNTGMLLFPGEEKIIDSDFTVQTGLNGEKYAICNGSCNRNKRPLACRIYPLFPIICENNNIKVVFDYRADCPLCEGDYKFDRKFIKAVKRVGEYLLLNEETAKFYRNLCDEMKEMITLYDKISKI